MDYLAWYKKVLKLPVKNNHRLVSIIPRENGLELAIQTPIELLTIRARKLVLATGRAGFGGLEMPAWVDQLPSSSYAHTGQIIFKQQVQNKRIIIVGCGASAFDAAAYALENGAHSVTMLQEDMLCQPSINLEVSLILGLITAIIH